MNSEPGLKKKRTPFHAVVIARSPAGATKQSKSEDCFSRCGGIAMTARAQRHQVVITPFWLGLIDEQRELSSEKARLIQESNELMKIFSAIMRKSE